MVSVLLVGVVIVVVAEYFLAAAEPERLGGIWIVGDHLRRQAVYRGRVGQGRELRLPGRIGGIRVRGEVMVKRIILVENHYHMFDRRGGIRGVNRQRRGECYGKRC